VNGLIATAAARGVRLDELIEIVLVEVAEPASSADTEAEVNWASDTDLLPADRHADIDLNDEVELDRYIDEWEIRPLTMTAHRAFILGLIDETERDAAVDQARTATQEQMQHVITSLVDEDDQLCSDLQAAMDDPYRFAALARRAKRHLSITTSTWTWPVTSLAAAIADDAVPARAVEHLAQVMRLRCKRRLERSMEQAARAAFDRFGYDANSIL
jgi:hypothetical protein